MKRRMSIATSFVKFAYSAVDEKEVKVEFFFSLFCHSIFSDARDFGVFPFILTF